MQVAPYDDHMVLLAYEALILTVLCTHTSAIERAPTICTHRSLTGQTMCGKFVANWYCVDRRLPTSMQVAPYDNYVCGVATIARHSSLLTPVQLSERRLFVHAVRSQARQCVANVWQIGIAWIDDYLQACKWHHMIPMWSCYHRGTHLCSHQCN